MKVSELMSPQAVCIAPEETAALAARMMARYNVGSLPVCGSDGAVRGVVTDRDIAVRCVAAERDPGTTAVSRIMSRSVITVGPEEDVKRASELMAAGQVRRLPVTKGGRLVGVLALGDLAKVAACDMEASHALTEISLNLRER